MRSLIAVIAAVTWIATPISAAATCQPEIFRENFEDGLGQWRTLGSNGRRGYMVIKTVQTARNRLPNTVDYYFNLGWTGLEYLGEINYLAAAIAAKEGKTTEALQRAAKRR